jgi:two-component system, LytTR family, response regulator
MRAILVDDEPDGIRTLKKLLELNSPDVEIIASCTDTDLAKKKVQQLQPDVVFLDVQMPGKSGLDFLSELPERNFEVIFVTAHNDYVLPALRFSAVDYLMKPVDQDKLVEALQRARKKISKNKMNESTDTLLYNLGKVSTPSEMRLCLASIKGFTVLTLQEIIYCEALRSYTTFHLTNNKSVTVSKPLFEYEKLLEDTIFFRVHKSFLINMFHVREYLRNDGGTVVMSDGKTIEISRRRKDLFLNKIKEVFRFK